MKTVPFYVVLCFALCLVLPGCGDSGTKVIEAPPADDSSAAMEGMDDDEYNKAMTESMGQQGN